MSRIKLLPELVINQIAAGEVIERPASVLKELLENSIDASSSMIRVYLEEGGRSNIKVVDNGIGIHAEDLSLIGLQHATSKITDLNDLNGINSLGFRGEALASIASVANFTIKSQQNEPSGTTVEVRDLFYNVPVRKKFLKPKHIEFNYLQEIFKKISLSNFCVGFMLYHDNKLLKNLPIVVQSNEISRRDIDVSLHIKNKEKRIIKLLGNRFIEHAVFFSSKIADLELSGWIVNNPLATGINIQYFYINNRIIKDKLLNSAIKKATIKQSLPLAYCLYLNLDPVLLDVNVHPTKQEVRFSDPRIIYAFIYDSISEVISKHSSNIKLDTTVNSNEKSSLFKHNYEFSEINNDNNESKNYSDYYENQIKNKQNFTINSTDNIDNHDLININTVKTIKDVHNIKLFPLFNNQYVIYEEYDKLVFIDVHDGIKWLIKNKLQHADKLTDWHLVIPERIKIDYSYNFEAYLNHFAALKFDINQIHENVFLIQAVPYFFKTFDINLDYYSLINNLCKYKLTNTEQDNVYIINIILANITIPSLQRFNEKYLCGLVDELLAANFYCSKLSQQEINNLLKKEKYKINHKDTKYQYEK